MTVFIPPTDINKKNNIMLSVEKSHYLFNVMRCKKGDLISVIDGLGKVYKAEIQSIKNGIVFIDILKDISLDTESPFNLILCQGIIKGQKMDIVIQKTTELGIKRIVPIISERVIVKETNKLKRWKKIAEEATEQCGRAFIPIIEEPIKIENFFSQVNSNDSQTLKGLIFWEEGGEPIKDALKRFTSVDDQRSTPLYIFIGPEGGLTSQEVGLAEEAGFVKTTLGKRLLKSETAAIVSVAIVQFLLESEKRFSV